MKGQRKFSESINDQQQQRIKNQQHYLEITKAVEDDLRISEEELSVIESTTSLAQPSKLDYLWNICENSKERSKLILPDSLHTPFYLPQKMVYEKSDLQLEREKRRLEFLIQRDLKELIPGKIKDLDSLLPAAAKISPREQAISNRILNEYRLNPDRYDQLQRHIQEQKKQKHKDRPPLPFASVSAVLENKHKPHKSVSSRIQEAKMRREQLHEEEISKKVNLKKDLDDKLNTNHQKMKDILFNPLTIKQKLWLKVLSVVTIMSKTHEKVAAYREIKAKDIVRWKKAIVIQKAYRKYRDRQNGGVQRKAMMKRFRQSMMSINPESSKLLHTRVEACSIITDFLISIQKNWKNFALNYIRKIKLIQRRWRKHMLLNHYRYLLILSYLEKLFPFLLIHFSCIMNGKGHDVQNLLATDLNQLTTATKYYSFYSMTQHVNTSPFHKFLREMNQQRHNPNILQHIIKYFGLFLNAPVHHQHVHLKRLDMDNAGSGGNRGTPKGKHHPRPPNHPHSHSGPPHHPGKQGGHHKNHGHHPGRRASPFAKLTAVNPIVGTMPHPFFSNPELTELQSSSNVLHQHNIRILTYQSAADPSYFQSYSTLTSFHPNHPSHHPFAFSYHKYYTLLDIIIKQCILQLIYRKRLNFIGKMDENNPILTEFKFDVNDIKSFIHGEGYDPLQAQIETMMKKQEAQFLQHQNYQIQKSLPYGASVKQSASVAGGSSQVGGNSEINAAIAQAISNADHASTKAPFTTRDTGGTPHHHKSSLLNEKDMEEFDVFANPHIYKNSQLTMLMLREITGEDVVTLLTEITEILQLIPSPYLGNSNYNQSYLQLARNQYLKNLKPIREIRKTMNTTTAVRVPRLSGIEQFTSAMEERRHQNDEVEHDPSLISSFLFIDDSQSKATAPVSSASERSRRITIQKGIPQHLSLLVQSNDFYQDVYEFFHHYVGKQHPPMSASHTHRSVSTPGNEQSETQRSSREGSVNSQASGVSNPVSIAAIAAAAAARRAQPVGNPAQLSSLRKSILAGRSEMHRMSLMVTHHQRQSVFVKRKTSVIPENQRKYFNKSQGKSGDDLEEDDDEDEDEDEGGRDRNTNVASSRRMSSLSNRQRMNLMEMSNQNHNQPSRPTFIRKSSIMHAGGGGAAHRKLSTAIN